MDKIDNSLLDKYGRLLSLDFYRGLTMFLLVAEGAGLWYAVVEPYFQGSIISAIGSQFHHHPWNGLRFWDLVQPFFMFIVGVAMPISFGKRWDKGHSWGDTFKHTLYRSFMLLMLGLTLHCIYSGEPVFELWNVLSQLSFTYLVAFLIMRKSWKFQISFSVGLLIITELLYRLWSVEGFNQPFTPDKNFGAWMDLVLMGKLSGGHWVAVNAIPTAAHTIWGVIAGQLLISKRETTDKLKKLLLFGIGLVVLGYLMDPLTPIIKRIATTSFTIVSGGWCLLVLAASFYIFDVRKSYEYSGRFFAIVGMNPLFIYLFSEMGGVDWFYDMVDVFTSGFLGGPLPTAWVGVITSLIVLGLMWYLTYFLYKRKIFISI
ncbi:DUF5009 domain-containing protein [Aliifodinibius salicampi]|uniref:DUF5009 domain-containing protein n=1 Tax=Fodinibius salicampi TaxID=1920655 RepID=A0ABT3PYI3_9BACT|nr:DUF5009 domain-containing protein [Fodinibius salicampi]MCW9712910.1 DUF5009 domain-containing protein [Fodinibius salicampi]